MADVKHPFHLGLGLVQIVKIGVLSVDGVPGGCLEVAFAHGAVCVVHVKWSVNKQGPRPLVQQRGDMALIDQRVQSLLIPIGV